MKKVGIFGGTFNPIHSGHVRLAQEYIRVLGLDHLLVIPAKYPPHKQAKDLAPSLDRLEMCRLAFQGCLQAEISDLEIRRPGKSFTVDTVRSLLEREPDIQLYLLVGGDMFRTFSQWFCFQEILEKVTLCTAAREAGELALLKQAETDLRQYSQNLLVLDIPVMEVSSTEIRKKLAEDQDCKDLLPGPVLAYIREKGLYRPDVRHQAQVEQYTALIHRMLKPSRYEHSLNVARRAVYLADLYGEDPKKAEIAGLLHDICKNMRPEEQLHWMQKSGIILDKTILTQPQLWHGIAAAQYVQDELSICDKQIIDAIRYHTVGRAGMSLLEQIIFLADLTSAERDYGGADRMRRVVEISLDEGMKASLDYTLHMLLERQSPICLDTCQAYNEYVLKGIQP